MSDHDEHTHEGSDEHAASGHDHPAHGTEPLPGVDPSDLHGIVDELAGALHAYVEAAIGVRAEFGAHEADEDPRILALESRVSGLNAALYDVLHDRLGLHSDLTGMTWEDSDGAGDDDDLAPHDDELDAFHLGFVVGPPSGLSDLSMDSVLGIVDDGGAEIARRLMDSGFDVTEWGASRGVPVEFEHDEDAGDTEE